MKRLISFFAFFSTLLATVISAPGPLPSPAPTPQSSPLAAIGNFIQRLQTSFQEGTSAIGPPTGNAYSLPLSPSSTTTTTTTTTTTRRPQVKNAFDSINAILDNISRSGKSTGPIGNSIENNNVFGKVPGRRLNLPPVSTPRPFFPSPTTRSPFNLDGINQGINAFFQAFLKTNIEKIFKPQQGQGQEQQLKRQIEPRSDQNGRPPSFGEIFINNLFRKQNN